jgi:hypothetical protein
VEKSKNQISKSKEIPKSNPQTRDWQGLAACHYGARLCPARRGTSRSSHASQTKVGW